jgi:hypothetical protein
MKTIKEIVDFVLKTPGEEMTDAEILDLTVVGLQEILETKKCEKCEFWSPHKRQGTCSQMVETSSPRKLYYQTTFEDYSCSTFEKKQ